MRRLAPFALLLLGLAAALSARAEPPRDSMHPGDAEVFEWPDPQGLTSLLDHRQRSPSGILYPYPPALQQLDEIGGGDTETETRYTKYADRDSGFGVSGLNFEAWRPETGDYAMLRAGSLDRDDQFYDFEASRAGWVR